MSCVTKFNENGEPAALARDMHHTDYPRFLLYSAVVGSITLPTSVTLVAGNPLSSACF
jgi:hypothetical protein